jgi:energy-coupling factor transporter transmembrane protein EcfT
MSEPVRPHERGPDEAKRRPRRPVELNLLRPVPGDTPVHRLWAGTKLVSLAALVVGLSFRPTWPAVGVVGAFVLGAMLLARISPGAAPKLPRWFWAALALGAVLSLRSTRAPTARVGPTSVSLGALEQWGLYTLLALVLLACAALVSWTTPLAEVAPALSALGRPLRWLRFPVDEWAVAAALSIRCLPLLTDEIRTLTAARRLRHRERPKNQSHLEYWIIEAQDMLLASLAVSLRRAHDLGEAIEARGGFGVVSDSRSGPRLPDLVAVIVVGATIAGALLV